MVTTKSQKWYGGHGTTSVPLCIEQYNPSSFAHEPIIDTMNTVSDSNLTCEHIFWNMWSELFALAIEDDSADGIHFCIIFPSVSKDFIRKHLK